MATLNDFPTPSVGGSGGSPFDDLSAASGAVIAGIKSITIRSGDVVDAIQVEYLLSNGGSFMAPQHGGAGGTAQTIQFAAGETLIALQGRSGQYIDQLSFRTRNAAGQENSYGPYGGNGGAPFVLNGGIKAFFGRSGTFLDSIGVYIDAPSSKLYGGGGGSGFADSTLILEPAVVGITSLAINWGTYVDSIQATYLLANGAQHQSAPHGGSGGTQTLIQFEAGEQIISVAGRSGQYVDQLSFVTRTASGEQKTYGPYGGSGGTPFAVNTGVRGFFGRSGTYLDAIGFYLDPPSAFVTQIAVSSDLAQAYRMVTPISTSTSHSLCTFYNSATGQTEAFVASAQNGIFRLFRDNQSETGWSSQDMQFPGSVSQMMCGTEPDGTAVIYAVDRSLIVYSRRSTQGWSGSWQAAPNIIGTPWPPSGTVSYILTRGIALDNARNLVPCFLILDHTMGFGYLATIENGKWNLLWWYAEVYPIGSEVCQPGLLRGVNGAPATLGIYRVRQPFLPPAALDAFRGGASWPPHWPALPGTWKPLTCVRSAARPGAPTGSDDLLATDSNNQLYLIALDATGTTLQPTLIPGSAGLAANACVARRRSSGLMDIFCIDQQQHLYHCQEDPNGPSGWGPFVRIAADHAVQNVYLCDAPDDALELFTYDVNGSLWRVWNDAQSEQPGTGGRDPEWQIDNVQLDQTQNEQVEEIRAYVVNVVVYDATQSPLPNTAVKIYADDGVWIEVNAATVWVDAEQPYSGTTNSQGQLLLTVPTTALGVPALGLWFSPMPADDRVSLDLSAGIQAQLSGIGTDGQQLLAAKVQDDEGQRNQPLVPPAMQTSPNVPKAAQAINSAIAMLANAGSHDAQPRPELFHHANDARVTRYLGARVQDGRSSAPPLRRLHMPSIPSQAWRVSFAGGSLDYAELSAEEAQQHVVQTNTLVRVPARKVRGALVMARTGKPLTAAAVAAAGDDEDDGWSWGDIWEGVKSGAAVVYDYVVQPIVDAASGVVDAVSTVITLVIDGVRHVFTCLIDLVEQVFDLVEEALRWIGVQFEQLFRWLGEVMGWAGIMRTKEVIKQQLLNMLQLASMVVPVLEAKLAGQITTFGTWASAKMDQFNQIVLGDQNTLGATRERAQGQTTPALASTMHRSQGLNLIGNAFVNNLGRVPDVAGGSGAELAATRMAALPADVAAPVTDLLSQLASTGQAWSSAQAFEDALAYLSRIPSDPEHMLQLALAALVSACKGILQLVLDAALVVLQQLALAIQAVLSSIEQAWTAPGLWRIPFVSALYEKLSGGGQLSPIDLTALMLAMPTTWLYRAAHDAPPFPDDASFASFNATYSTALLAKHMGLSQASMPNAAALAETDPPEPSAAQVTVAERVFLWLNAVNNVVYSFVDVFLDLQLSPMLGATYKLKSLDSSATQQNIGSWVAYSLGWTGLLCGIPWYDLSKMQPGCDTPDQFGAIHLIIEGVENLINSVFFFAGGTLMRMNDTFGPYIVSGFGFVHLVMNAVESGWAASLHEGNALSALEGVFGSIPLVFKFLHATPVIEASEGTSWIALLVIDAVGDLVMIACSIANAATA